MATTLMACVVFDPASQPGQEHRSSGNFSTDSMPDGTTAFKWEIKNRPGPSSVRFDVKQDVGRGKDHTWFTDVTNDEETQNRLERCRSLYVANPQGAGSADFTVEVYAVS